MFIRKPLPLLLFKEEDADRVATYKLFVCCIAWNLDKLVSEAEKAQPMLSNIIGAMCLYACLAEQHQMAFDMVLLPQGHSLLCSAASNLNQAYRDIEGSPAYKSSGCFA